MYGANDLIYTKRIDVNIHSSEEISGNYYALLYALSFSFKKDEEHTEALVIYLEKKYPITQES